MLQSHTDIPHETLLKFDNEVIQSLCGSIGANLSPRLEEQARLRTKNGDFFYPLL